MWLLILEALLALALLVGIVAWTMSGRRREPPVAGPERGDEAAVASKTGSDNEAAGAARPAPAADPGDRHGARGG